MQVKENKIDELNRSVTFMVEKADYAEAKKKKLNEARRKAEIKGFRKGMAPMSLIEKIYGGNALGEAINEIVTESLNKYVEDNKLNLIGEALPNEEANKNDWDNAEDFSFTFDMGICPEINVAVSAEDSIPYHEISVTAKAVAEYKENLLRQFGTMEAGEAAKEDDFIVADFAQGETVVTNAYVALRSIEDSYIKAKFIGIKVGDSLDVNVNDTFKNETDRAALLKVKKEELAGMDPMWKMTVKEVKTFVAAKAEQATFDKIYGAGVVTSQEEFDKKIKEQLKNEYASESDYRFSKDAREYFVKKANIALPEAFIKRWLFVANEGKFTMEDIEKEFDLFLADYRWQLIRTKIMKEQKLQVTKEDMENEAKSVAAYQFAMYGLNNAPEDQLKSFAEKILSDNEQARRIFEKVENDIVMKYVRGIVTLDKKKTTVAKMREMNN